MITAFDGDVNSDVILDCIKRYLKTCKIVHDKKATAKAKNVQYFYRTSGAYDTETSTIKKNKVDEKTGLTYVNPQCSWVYHVQLIIADMYITFRYIEKCGDFLLKLSAILKDLGTTKLIILIANLNFEWTFIKPFLLENITDYFAKAPTKPLYIEIGGNIVLKEVIGLYGSSLNDISAKWTTTKKLKGELDYNLIRTPKTAITEREAEYMYNDVKILAELCYIMFEQYLDRIKKIPLTKTGKLRQECRELLKNRIRYIYADNAKLIPLINYDILKSYRLFRSWRKFLYQGGYAHSNAAVVGRILNNLIYADITSAYPFQMLTKRFPAGELKQYDKRIDDANEIITKKHYIATVVFSEIVSKSEHTLISRNKILNLSETSDTIFHNGRLYRGNNIAIFANEIDMKNIKAMYEGKYKIVDLWYFTKSRKIDKSIRKIIEHYYVTKQVKKERGEPYHEEKEAVNSFYGMFATSLYEWTVKLNGNIFVDKRDDNFNFKKYAHSILLNPYVAYWTTAYTREMLVKYISKYPNAVAQYDTDSLLFTGDISKGDLEKAIEEMKNENDITKLSNKRIFDDVALNDLGTWDFDYNVKRAKCMGAKRYLLEYDQGVKCTIAGLPKKALNEFMKNDTKKIFDLFAPNMYIPCIDSKKMTACYRHDNSPVSIDVTDYKGDTCRVKYRTYCALYEIPFKMNVEEAFIAECERLTKVI